ncbi:hypothetical protein B0H13DRAFT_2335619 [Mycena leptocephala]|nr:hypothetical protein B0H13DRAFT_2335619 [Mycena leptocephala]
MADFLCSTAPNFNNLIHNTSSTFNIFYKMHYSSNLVFALVFGFDIVANSQPTDSSSSSTDSDSDPVNNPDPCTVKCGETALTSTPCGPDHMVYGSPQFFACLCPPGGALDQYLSLTTNCMASQCEIDVTPDISAGIRASFAPDCAEAGFPMNASASAIPSDVSASATSSATPVINAESSPSPSLNASSSAPSATPSHSGKPNAATGTVLVLRAGFMFAVATVLGSLLFV